MGTVSYPTANGRVTTQVREGVRKHVKSDSLGSTVALMGSSRESPSALAEAERPAAYFCLLSTTIVAISSPVITPLGNPATTAKKIGGYSPIRPVGAAIQENTP